MENLDQNITEQNNNQYIPNSHYVEPKPVKIKNKKFGLIILVVILLFLLGGGAFAFYKVSNIDVAKIMSNLEKVESVNFKVTSDVGLVPKPQDKTLDEVNDYSLFDYSSILPTSTTWSKTNISGAFDISDEDNIKSWFNLYFFNDKDKKEYIIDYITADKVNYFKVNYLPAILSFDLSFISNRWIRIDTSAGGEAGSIASIFSTITKRQEEIIEENQVDMEAVKEEYKNLLLQNPILEIEKKFLPTRLNGDFVYHVAYKINEVNLRKVVEGYYKIENRLQEESFEKSDPNDEFMIQYIEEYNKNKGEQQKQKIENVVKYAKEISGEIWLGMVDLLPRKITFNFYSENEALYNELKVAGEVILNDYNKSVSITLPEESTGIDQIMTELFSGLSGVVGTETETKAKDDSRRLADVKQIQTALELFYMDQGFYPLAPTSIILGVANSTCFNMSGFSILGCDNPYMAIVPSDQMFGYVYKSVDGLSYTINTQLEHGVGNYQAGEIIITPNGIEQGKINEILYTNIDFELDTDKDGLSDLVEKEIGTDINNPDTDSDGYPDNIEYTNGYNPLGK